MMIETFYITNDPEAMAVYVEVLEARQSWFTKISQVCIDNGFISFSGSDFFVPDYLLKPRHEQLFRGRGFAPVIDNLILPESDFQPYTFRRDYPIGNDIYLQLEDISHQSLLSIDISPTDYGKPLIQSGYIKAACMKLGINHVINNGSITAFSQIWAVICPSQQMNLICSIPVEGKGVNGSNSYDLPPMAEYWQDINAQKVIEVFNFHNKQLGTAKA